MFLRLERAVPVNARSGGNRREASPSAAVTAGAADRSGRSSRRRDRAVGARELAEASVIGLPAGSAA